MKKHRAITARQEQLAERALYGAILTLRTVDECRDFFRDLCTPAELQAMADRWAVVEFLQRGLPYREIHASPASASRPSGASPATSPPATAATRPP